MTTITIDGYAWSGREQVASLLAKALNSKLIDGNYLALSAERRGIDHDLFLNRLETDHSLTRRVHHVFDKRSNTLKTFNVDEI